MNKMFPVWIPVFMMTTCIINFFRKVNIYLCCFGCLTIIVLMRMVNLNFMLWPAVWMNLEFYTWIKNGLNSSSMLLVKWSWDFLTADPASWFSDSKWIKFQCLRLPEHVLPSFSLYLTMNGLSVASYWNFQ